MTVLLAAGLVHRISYRGLTTFWISPRSKPVTRNFTWWELCCAMSWIGAYTHWRFAHPKGLEQAVHAPAEKHKTGFRSVLASGRIHEAKARWDRFEIIHLAPRGAGDGGILVDSEP